MSFKKYINNLLNEGLGQVKRDFLNPGKIDKEDLKRIKVIGANKDLAADYTEWLAKFLVDQGFANLGRARRALFTKDIYNRIKSVVKRFDDMLKKKASRSIPYGKTLEELEEIVDDIEFKYYSNKKADTSGLSRDEYEEYINNNKGIQIFKAISKNAIQKLGSGTQWCITQDDDENWNNYTGNYCFYVLRDHRLNSNNPFYKIAIQVDTGGDIEDMWDAEDDNLGSRGVERYFERLEGIDENDFEWFESDRDPYDIEEVKEQYDSFIEELENAQADYESEKESWAEYKAEEYKKEEEEKLETFKTDLENYPKLIKLYGQLRDATVNGEDQMIFQKTDLEPIIKEIHDLEITEDDLYNRGWKNEGDKFIDHDGMEYPDTQRSILMRKLIDSSKETLEELEEKIEEVEEKITEIEDDPEGYLANKEEWFEPYEIYSPTPGEELMTWWVEYHGQTEDGIREETWEYIEGQRNYHDFYSPH